MRSNAHPIIATSLLLKLRASKVKKVMTLIPISSAGQLGSNFFLSNPNTSRLTANQPAKLVSGTP
jgi:hypothetical protein